MSADIAHATTPQDTMPAWTTPKQALVLSIQPQTLRRTIAIALLVGSLLSLINQGGALAHGNVALGTWLKVLANYIVPFCVSSAGFVAATRRRVPGSGRR